MKLFFVSECFDRLTPISNCVPGHYLTVSDVDSIIRGACSAIEYLHTKGFAHGDISSDNFFVSSATVSNR